MNPNIKPHFPDRRKLDRYIDSIYSNRRLTNSGPLVSELTDRLKEYLGVENLLLVANGTLALQVAYRVLGINERVITTPFSFVATTSSLLWQGIDPKFCDIDIDSYCLNSVFLDECDLSRVQGIVPVHVFGNTCDITAIESFCKKNKLKSVYDSAHAFGVEYNGKGVLNYGDASVLSFHATKLFHSVEGGAISFKKNDDFLRAQSLINFGINQEGVIEEVGINAKMNEFEAAVGLCVLDDIDYILELRKGVADYYCHFLSGYVSFQKLNRSCSRNYSYFPVLFEKPEEAEKARKQMSDVGIESKRYFSPSLDSLYMFAGKEVSYNSRYVSDRILCLPIGGYSVEKDKKILDQVVDIVRGNCE